MKTGTKSRIAATILLTGGFAVTSAPAGIAAPNRTVRGDGSGVLVLPPWTGDRLAIAVDAVEIRGASAPDESGRGSFEVTHFDKSGGVYAHVTGTVTCVSVRGNTAFVSGRVDEGHIPQEFGDPVGRFVGLTIVDQDQSNLTGIIPPVFPTAPPPCAPAPIGVVVDQGGYSISPG